MAAHAQGGCSARDLYGIFKRRTRSHEGGRGEGASSVQLSDGAVDAYSKAKIVCVNDEAGGHELEEQRRVNNLLDYSSR